VKWFCPQFPNPGRTRTVVNDRLRRLTEVNEDRLRPPCTISVYGAERQETDSVYGGREKIRRFRNLINDAPFTEFNGDKRLSFRVVYHRMRPYTIVIYISDRIGSVSNQTEQKSVQFELFKN